MSRGPNGSRGGAAVGRLRDLRHVERASVMFLRLWCEGPDGQGQVRSEAVALLGDADGCAWCEAFGDALELTALHGRRPLVRHAVGCPCLGADEAVIALLVSTAAELDRHEALMLAALAVRADSAPALADLARTVGLGIKRMGGRSARPLSLGAPASEPDGRRPPVRTLH